MHCCTSPVIIKLRCLRYADGETLICATDATKASIAGRSAAVSLQPIKRFDKGVRYYIGAKRGFIFGTNYHAVRQHGLKSNQNNRSESFDEPFLVEHRL
jgi:hypothetical protein